MAESNPSTLTGYGKDPLATSHGDALLDQNFQSLKSKEVRDSMSPTHELKFHSMSLSQPNTTGWDVQTSSEVSPDGRAYRTETLAKTDGVEKLNGGGIAEFKGRNEQRSSASHQGDDKNFVKKASESSNTQLQEQVVFGDEQSGRTEMKMSSTTSSSSSKVVSSSSTVEYGGDEPQQPRYLMDKRREDEQLQQQQQQRYHEQRLEEQRIEQLQQQQQQQREERFSESREHSNTTKNVETQQHYEQNKRYVDMDKASPEYQRHVQHLMAQPGEIISNTVEYPKPNVKMITTVKRLPDGTIVKNKRYETEQLTPSNQSETVRQRQDQVDNAEHLAEQVTQSQSFSSVKKSSRRFSTETTSETVEEYGDDQPSKASAPVRQDFSTQGFPSVRPNKPTQEFAGQRPSTPQSPRQPSSDFSTHGFPSVRANKPTQEFTTQRPSSALGGEEVLKVQTEQSRHVKQHSSSQRTVETELIEGDQTPKTKLTTPSWEKPVVNTRRTPVEEFSTQGFPSQPRTRPDQPDGEVIHTTRSVSHQHSAKHKTNTERIIETQVEEPEQQSRRTSQPLNASPSHGYPSARSPTRSTPTGKSPTRKPSAGSTRPGRNATETTTTSTVTRRQLQKEREVDAAHRAFAASLRSSSPADSTTSVGSHHHQHPRRDSGHSEPHQRLTPRSSISSNRTYRRDAREGSHDSHAPSETSRISSTTVTRHVGVPTTKSVGKSVVTKQQQQHQTVVKSRNVQGSNETIDLMPQRSPKSPSPASTTKTTTTTTTVTKLAAPSSSSSPSPAPDNQLSQYTYTTTKPDDIFSLPPPTPPTINNEPTTTLTNDHTETITKTKLSTNAATAKSVEEPPCTRRNYYKLGPSVPEATSVEPAAIATAVTSSETVAIPKGQPQRTPTSHRKLPHHNNTSTITPHDDDDDEPARPSSKSPSRQRQTVQRETTFESPVRRQSQPEDVILIDEQIVIEESVNQVKQMKTQPRAQSTEKITRETTLRQGSPEKTQPRELKQSPERQPKPQHRSQSPEKEQPSKQQLPRQGSPANRESPERQPKPLRRSQSPDKEQPSATKLSKQQLPLQSSSEKVQSSDRQPKTQLRTQSPDKEQPSATKLSKQPFPRQGSPERQEPGKLEKVQSPERQPKTQLRTQSPDKDQPSATKPSRQTSPRQGSPERPEPGKLENVKSPERQPKSQLRTQSLDKEQPSVTKPSKQPLPRQGSPERQEPGNLEMVQSPERPSGPEKPQPKPQRRSQSPDKEDIQSAKKDSPVKSPLRSSSPDKEQPGTTKAGTPDKREPEKLQPSFVATKPMEWSAPKPLEVQRPASPETQKPRAQSNQKPLDSSPDTTVQSTEESLFRSTLTQKVTNTTKNINEEFITNEREIQPKESTDGGFPSKSSEPEPNVEPQQQQQPTYLKKGLTRRETFEDRCRKILGMEEDGDTQGHYTKKSDDEDEEHSTEVRKIETETVQVKIEDCPDDEDDDKPKHVTETFVLSTQPVIKVEEVPLPQYRESEEVITHKTVKKNLVQEEFVNISEKTPETSFTSEKLIECNGKTVVETINQKPSTVEPLSKSRSSLPSNGKTTPTKKQPSQLEPELVESKPRPALPTEGKPVKKLPSEQEPEPRFTKKQPNQVEPSEGKPSPVRKSVNDINSTTTKTTTVKQTSITKEVPLPKVTSKAKSPRKESLPKREPAKRDSLVDNNSTSIKDRLRSSPRKPKSQAPDNIDGQSSSPDVSPTRIPSERRRSSNISVHTEIIIDHTSAKSPRPERKLKPSASPARKLPVTERKESAPVPRVTRRDKDKVMRSTSENVIKVVNGSKAKPLPEMSSLRPSKCFTTKTIKLSEQLINSEDMENVIIDIQQAKSSREPTPDRIVPTPVSAELDTGKPRYPDVVQEPDDEPRQKPLVTNIPIFEEETNAYVGFQISELRSTNGLEHDILDNPMVEAPKSLEDECLMSVHEKVTKFTHTAEQVKQPKASTPFSRQLDLHTNVSNSDECLLSINQKVDKFLKTAEDITKQPMTVTRQVEAVNYEEMDEELRQDECTLSVSQKVNKFIDTAEKLAPTLPQKSPRLVAHIERHHVTRQSEPELEQESEPEDLKGADLEEEPSLPMSKNHTTALELKRQKDILSRPSVFGQRKPVSPKPKISPSSSLITEERKSQRQQTQTRVLKPTTTTDSAKKPVANTKRQDHITPQQWVLSDVDVEVEEVEPAPAYQGTKSPSPSRRTVVKTTTEHSTKHTTHTSTNPPKSSTVDLEPNVESLPGPTKPSTARPTPATTVASRRHVFEKPSTPSSSSPEPLSGRRPSYMDHTKSSLEHIRRDSLEINKSNYTRKSSIEDEFNNEPRNPNAAVKFDVPHRGKEKEEVKTHELEIEEIFDLQVLEQLLETVSSYELRRRIRAQMRLIRKNMINAAKTHERSHSPESKTISSKLKEVRRQQTRTEQVDSTSPQGKPPVKPRERSASPANQSQRRGSPQAKVQSITKTTTTTHSARSSPSSPALERRSSKPSGPIWADRSKVLRGHTPVASNGSPISTRKGSASSTTSSSSKVTRTQTSSSTSSTSSSTKRRTAEDSITSSYGVGPTDENGLPLFGIRALKKKTPQPSSGETTQEVTGYVIEEQFYSDSKSPPRHERKELIYSSNADELSQLQQQLERKSSQDSNSNQVVVREFKKIDGGSGDVGDTKYVRRGSVKELSEKFIRREQGKEQELIDTETEDSEDTSLCSVIEVPQLRQTSSSSSTTRSSNTRSFLNTQGEDRLVTSVDDVLDRMRNADNVSEPGDNAEDREARALLNKFLGASVLMQGVESMLQPGAIPSSGQRQTGQAVKTTRITNTYSKTGSSSSNTSSTPVSRTTCDIEEIWDEQILKQLLEQASTYEERRKIRARLRELMAEREAQHKQQSSTTSERTETKSKDGGATVTTTTTKVTTRTVSGSNAAAVKNISPLAKFKQLDKQAAAEKAQKMSK